VLRELNLAEAVRTALLEKELEMPSLLRVLADSSQDKSFFTEILHLALKEVLNPRVSAVAFKRLSKWALKNSGEKECLLDSILELTKEVSLLRNPSYTQL
jgi:hypothetical protein